MMSECGRHFDCVMWQKNQTDGGGKKTHQQQEKDKKERKWIQEVVNFQSAIGISIRRWIEPAAKAYCS